MRPFRAHGLGLVWPYVGPRARLQFTSPKRDENGIPYRWHHAPTARAFVEETAARLAERPDFAGVKIEVIAERR